MAYIWAEPFSRLGPVGLNYTYGNGSSTGTSLLPILNATGLTSLIGNGNISLGSPITSYDQCSLQFLSTNANNNSYGIWTLPANMAVVNGSMWVYPLNMYGSFFITFTDSGSGQFTIQINSSSGTISLKTGGNGGTNLSTSTYQLPVNTGTCISWSVTIGSSGAAYQVNIGTTVLFSGTGNTRGGTSNNQANGFILGYSNAGSGGNAIMNVSHLILADGTGTSMNAIWTNKPIVVEDYPTSDNSVAFTQSVVVLGQDYSNSTGNSAPGANTLILRKYTPAVNMTLNSVSSMCATNSGTANVKAVAYADSGGSPTGAPLGTGTQTTGVSSGTTVTSAFGSGIALTGGSPYWIGFITDTSWSIPLADGTATGIYKSNTYSSGAPTSPTGFTTSSSWAIWGNCSGAASNYVAEVDNPALGNSYNSSSTVNQQDIFNFPSIPTTLGTIFGVAAKALMSNPAGGVRTANIVISSSGNVTNGTYSGFSPTTTPVWQRTFTATDPATGSAWVASGVNAAIIGYKVAS